MVVNMLHFLISAIILCAKLRIWLVILFTCSALFHTVLQKKEWRITPLIILSPLIIIIPLPVSAPLCGVSLLAIFLMPPKTAPMLKFWELTLANLNLLNKLYFHLHMPKKTINKLTILSYFILTTLTLLLVIIFAPPQSIFLALSATFFIVRRALLGSSTAYYFLLLRSTPQPQNPSTKPKPLFPTIKDIIDRHPLNAAIQESLHANHLTGNIFIAYPLFFKAELPPRLQISDSQQIKTIWHTLRWESTLSKQLGSGALRWSSIANSSTTPEWSYAIHITLIPVYSNLLLKDLKTHKLPFFDPFSQPPGWRPLAILTDSLGWPPDETLEDRIDERSTD